MFRSKNRPEAGGSKNTEKSDARSRVQSMKSRLFSCLPIKARSSYAEVGPPQQEGSVDIVPKKPQTQSTGFGKSCLNPLYAEDPATEQHPGQLSYFSERTAQPPDQPTLTPRPSQSQANKVREAEEAVSNPQSSCRLTSRCTWRP